MYEKKEKRPGETGMSREGPGRTPSSITLGAKGRTEKRSSREEHRVDALALRADERRDKLRKAAGSCT